MIYNQKMALLAGACIAISSAAAAGCEAAKDELVTKVGKKAPELTPARLRIIVRDAQYVAYYEEMERKSADGHRLAVRRKIGDDLFALLASPGPDTIGIVGDDRLGDLKLSEDAAWAMAYRQTWAGIPPLPHASELKQSGHTFLGYEYGASMLTDLDGWSKVATAAGPDLLMAVVSDQYLSFDLIPDGSNLDEFREWAEEECATQPQCVSPNIYRFRGGKWVIAEAPHSSRIAP